MRAVFNDTTVALSDETIELEGYHYFPPDSVDPQYLRPSRMKSLCFWKGVASWHHVVVGDTVAARAAWTYRHPSPLARRIKGHVAFWNEVQVRPD